MSKRRFEGDFFSGIKLGLPRMSDDWTKEIQRNTQASTSGAEIIARVQGSQTVYPDRLPPDGVRRHYRVRAVGPTTCYGKSNWSRWVSAKPKLEVNPSPGPSPSSRIIRDPSGGNETLKPVVQNLSSSGRLSLSDTLDALSFGSTRITSRDSTFLSDASTLVREGDAWERLAGLDSTKLSDASTLVRGGDDWTRLSGLDSTKLSDSSTLIRGGDDWGRLGGRDSTKLSDSSTLIRGGDDWGRLGGRDSTKLSDSSTLVRGGDDWGRLGGRDSTKLSDSSTLVRGGDDWTRLGGRSSSKLSRQSTDNTKVSDIIQFLGATGNIDEANLRFGATGRLAQFIRQQSESGPQNLLAQDAGPEHSFTVQYFYLGAANSGAPISDLGLGAGDTVSFSGDIKTDGAAGAQGQLEIYEFDSAGNRTVSGGTQESAAGSTTYERLSIENHTLRGDTVEISIIADNANDDGNTIFARRAMLNRGPIAHSFVEPAFRSQREDADDIFRQSTLTSTTDIKLGDVAFSGGQIKVNHSGEEHELYTYDNTTALGGVAVGIRDADSTGTPGDSFTIRSGAEDLTIPGRENSGLNGNTTYWVGYNRTDDNLITSTAREDSLGKDITHFGDIVSADDGFGGSTGVESSTDQKLK